MAKGRLGGQGGQQPGYAAQPQQGWDAEPTSGPLPGSQPQQGWQAEPRSGPLPGSGAQPGWAAQPQAGPVPGRRFGGARFPSSPGSDIDADSVEDLIAGVAMGAAAKFIGRKIGRKMQQAYEERVVPALAAKQEAALRQQIAIAERHPDLRACMTDQVIFLEGGSRTMPLQSVTAAFTGGLTVEQSDAIVAQLRNG